LNKLATNLVSTDGIIAGRVDGINTSIKDIDHRQEDLTNRLSAIETRYRAQFTALDKMLSSLNQTSQFLQQQLATLPKNNS
jgi:flagellar hook-associated protein 2